MEICILDKDAQRLIRPDDPEAVHIKIGLDLKVYWDDIEMSNDLEVICEF